MPLQELIDGQPLFPGESDVDQLYIIQRLLGPLPPAQNAAFLANPRFAGFKFGEHLGSQPRQLEARYRAALQSGALPSDGLDFMQRCLRCAPRLLCLQAACRTVLQWRVCAELHVPGLDA